jgi:hypothetical protein
MRNEVPTREARPGAARRLVYAAPACLLCAAALQAQAPAGLQQVLERLDRLEQQNRALAEEVHALRQQLAAARSTEPAPLAERVAVQEARTEELAETKVEASERFPIRITGMALFNTFLNSKSASGGEYPTYASSAGARSAGAGFRQTTIGLEYHGPRAFGDGKVRGSVAMDFFGGTGGALDQILRLRTAVVGIDWNSRSVEGGLEKPLISPRDPDSLAQVGVSPLSGAGNLWLWSPQVRFEQKVPLGAGLLRAQVAAIETTESVPGAPATGYSAEYEDRRPGVEGRFEFSRGTERRIEIAPGFHRSTTHYSGASIPSSVFSLDWFARPVAALDFKGAFFAGENVTPLGTGGYRQGFALSGWGDAHAVHSRGGWAQLTVRATARLAFHVFSGAQDDRNSDLRAGSIARNMVYGANFFYRLAPNVIVSLESTQARTNYLGAGTLLNNHYDLALAYLF